VCTAFQAHNHASTSSLNFYTQFLQAVCSSRCPTNSVKALKAETRYWTLCRKNLQTAYLKLYQSKVWVKINYKNIQVKHTWKYLSPLSVSFKCTTYHTFCDTIFVYLLKFGNKNSTQQCMSQYEVMHLFTKFSSNTSNHSGDMGLLDFELGIWCHLEFLLMAYCITCVRYGMAILSHTHTKRSSYFKQFQKYTLSTKFKMAAASMLNFTRRNIAKCHPLPYKLWLKCL